MSETHDSSPEEQGQSAEVELQRRRAQPAFVRELEHDLRTPLGVASMSLDVLSAQLPPDDPKMEPVEMAKRGIESVSNMLREAANREPFPEHPLSDVHEIIRTVLRTMCDRDYRCVVSVEGEPVSNKEKGDVLHISLAALPADIERYNVRASQSGFERILDNLIKNSMRKGAKNMRIEISKSAPHEISVSVSDDGEGMKLKILKTLRDGEGDSDKTEKDFMPGGTIEDHGHGVSAIRQIITQRSGGTLEIFSVKQSNVEDSSGDGQDQQSLLNHPYGSGVTFRFRLPVTSMKLNGDHPPVVLPPEAKLLTRRRIIGLVAASVGLGYLTLTNNESDEFEQTHRAISPLSDVIIDKNGTIVSFTFTVNGESVIFEANKPLPHLLRDIRTIPVNNGSLSIIEPAAVDGRQLRRMFMCAFPDGFFGHVDAAYRNSRQIGFVCAARSPNNDVLNLSTSPVHLLSDTVFNSRIDPAIIGMPRAESLQTKAMFDATSIALLRTSAFEAVASDLRGVASLLTRQTQHTHAASFNAVRPILLKLLNTHHALQTKSVSARNANELRRLLNANDHFIIPEKSVVDVLRIEPLSSEDTRAGKERGNSVCLQDVSPSEAQAMLRVT